MIFFLLEKNEIFRIFDLQTNFSRGSADSDHFVLDLLFITLKCVFLVCFLPKKDSKIHKTGQNHLKSPGMVKLRYPVLSQSWVTMIDTEKRKI